MALLSIRLKDTIEKMEPEHEHNQEQAREPEQSALEEHMEQEPQEETPAQKQQEAQSKSPRLESGVVGANDGFVLIRMKKVSKCTNR